MGYSFIIPVYNCRETLGRCVESIRQAALPDYEILLIDDGSDDGSGGLCDALAETFPEIRVFHQTHSGVSTARNTGLREARQAQILFVDGDDAVAGAAMGEILREQADLVIFGANTAAWPVPGALDWRREFVALFRENVLSPVWNKVYKKSIIVENSLGFREEMTVYEDLEFVLRYLSHCETVVNVPRMGYLHAPSGKTADRVRKLGPLTEYLQPLQEVLASLALPEAGAETVAMELFAILARERIALSPGWEIPEICRDFQRFSGKYTGNHPILRKLAEERVLQLWLAIRVRRLAGRWVRRWL